jgi:hypothetical protein
MGITIQSTSLAPPFGDYLVGAAGRDPITPLHEVTATGTLNPIGGEPIDLTGTYDDETDSLALANPTEGYTFTGVFDTTGSFDAIVGEYDGPDGAGFFGCLAGTSVPTEIYCGTFASKKPGTEGTWDILITGNQVAGIAFPNALSEGDPFAFEGTIETTGTMRDLTAGNEEPGVYTLTITGTLNTKTNTIEGTWTYNDLKAPLSESGNWSGSPCP